ncbi:MAG: HD domain-containing protein [Ruminiclostridium sp.]|nr:HD domain-containing protein [Ruminiclostridium sp.]
MKKEKKNGRFLCGLLTVIITAALTAVPSGAYTEKCSSGVENRALSVDPSAVSDGFSSVLYNNSNGLPTSEANAIAETSDGFIWIGSFAGLIRYDGNTFERISGMTSIKCLYVDSRDRLWIGTNDNGFAVMERGEYRMWNKLDGLRSAHTRAITEDSSGTIYIATTCGIATVDTDQNLGAIEDERIAEANMRELRIGSDDTIYGTTDTGDIMMIRGGKLIKYITTDENPLEGAGTIFPDPANNGVIYHEAVDFGLYRVDLNDGVSVLEKIDIDPLKYLKNIEYIDGKIWICAGNGVGVIDNGSFHLVENLNMNNNIGHVMTDYLGNLWFTSTRQGVMKVVPNRFSDLSERYDLPELVANSTCKYDDKLFVATDTGLIVLGENGAVSELPLTKAVSASGSDLGADDLIALLDGCRIRSIIRDTHERLWISTWRACGLLRYENDEVTAFTEEDGLLTGSIRAVCERNDGSVLVALTGGVNVIRDNAVVASYGSDDGIENTESLTVAEGSNGDIILGSNGGGLYVINEAGVRNVDVEDGLPSDIVMRLKYDKKRDLVWIVTSSAVAYMTPDYRVTAIKNFPYPNNFDLFENSSGDIWVLSSNGIYVTPAEELIANGDINPVFYSIDSGLSCITTANSYSDLTSDGELYIAGSTGVCKVNIEESFENINEMKVSVPFIDVDGVRVYPDSSGTFTIPSDTRKLTVSSYVFNYSLTNPMVSWQLEGFEDENAPISRSELVPVDYTNLRGGTYHFKLRVMDSMGRGNKEYSVTVTKETAFYEQGWFYIIAGLLFVIGIAAVVNFYIRRKTRAIEKKQQETMALVGEISEAFAVVIDMKDRYTNGHSSRVAKYTAMLSKELGYDDDTTEKHYRIALLHDIGKVGIPDNILNKPGKLTDDEFAVIKSHTSRGFEALKNIRIMPEIAVGAGSHHERPDGKGYPKGLKGDEIPRVAQIIAVADTFDAMYSDRPYRNRMNFERVVSIIKEVSGTQLTPDVVEAFLRLVDKGEFRAPDDDGGGSTESIENIRKNE